MGGDQAKPIGRRLRNMRVARGLTQRQIAEPRYTAAYISTIEAGRRSPSSAALAHFAKQLGVEVDEILTGRPPNLPARLTLDLQEGRAALARGRFDLAEKAFRQVAKTASRHDLDRVHARALEALGLAAERKSDVETALQRYEEATDLLEAGPEPVRVESVVGTARCHQMKGDIRYAIHILETYLSILRRKNLEDPLALMRVHSSLVWPYSEVGLKDRAADAARRALELEHRVEDSPQIANMHINVARSLLDQGHPQDALESLRVAEHIYRALDWKSEIARALVASGMVFSAKGDSDSARRALTSALETLRETSDVLNTARALTELARLERELGDDPLSVTLLEESLSLLSDGDVSERALVHRELGVSLLNDDPDGAEKHFAESIDLFLKTEERTELAASYRALGDLLEEKGNTDESRRVYRDGLLAVGGEPL
jgi:tetratricopeptide (TPR) repeat protein